MIVIIIAAGEATRWDNHLGVPKHFAPVDGEPIIHRTIRLLKQYKQIDKIYVVANSNDYLIKGTELYKPNHNPENFDADKFMNSQELWNNNGRTVVLYGDVYFTDEAMEQIINYEGWGWVLFGRAFASSYTGTPYGECFAQSIDSSLLAEHSAALRRIVDLYKRGVIKRCGGWEHYRAMLGIPDSHMDRHLVGEFFVHIDDFTEDFDFPSDYESFIENRERI